ncbi:MAG TPA: hypothetical protein VHW46_08395 [Terracidiphilus sp.]|nr:hypothetical protein [Terracidiphilus sp.]
MTRFVGSLAVFVFAVALVPMAPAQDVVAPIRQAIDGFNSGDTQSFFAACTPNQMSIIDEFAPYRWIGPHAAQDWAAAYDKHAQATGVTDGSVKYSKPTRIEIEGSSAYVIVPTVYVYKQNAKPTTEEGQMTFSLHREAAGWKITAWTWTGVKPHPTM